MLKFKTGDKIKLVDAEGTIDMTEGKVYEIVGVTPEGYPYIIDDVGDQGWWNARRFKLVPEYLTPEQVLQYFKEGRQDELEYFNPLRSAWKPYNDMGVYMINDLFNSRWRVKPVPKTIDYYGTELPKPIDISTLDGSTLVYVPQLHRGTVNPISVARAKKYHVHKDALYFSSYADAKLVLDTLRKPFKQ